MTKKQYETLAQIIAIIVTGSLPIIVMRNSYSMYTYIIIAVVFLIIWNILNNIIINNFFKK
jgi:uncharacterized membrane protein YdbT with pleckstrin-like domain